MRCVIGDCTGAVDVVTLVGIGMEHTLVGVDVQVSPINILSCNSDFAFLKAWIQAAGGMCFVCTMPTLIDTQKSLLRIQKPPFSGKHLPPTFSSFVHFH